MVNLRDFYQLSVVLTGYNEVHLRGTGVGEGYCEVLTALVSEDILSELFDCYTALQQEYAADAMDEQLRVTILASPKFGPVARNIVKMWYLSIWYQLPEDWRARYGVPGQSPGRYQDTQFVISPNAYVQGLVWPALHSHPMAAKQPGFGTWAFPPEDAPIPVNLEAYNND